LLTNAPTWQALLRAALYGAIHLIEGETVTLLLVAKRFTHNPVFVILSLAFWYWLWGVPGAILSTPIFWRLPRLCAIEFGRSLLLAIFSRVEGVSTTASDAHGACPWVCSRLVAV
jgi:hypothetical protein